VIRAERDTHAALAQPTSVSGSASVSGAAPRPPAHASTAVRDHAALLLAAEMYGLQLDQLAAVLGVSARRTAQIAARWVAAGQAETARLGPGPRWIWLTRAGLAACDVPYQPSPLALPRLAHLRAVTATRLALEAVPAYAAGRAHWRSERRLRARLGGRLGLRDHLPDGELHWPDDPPGPAPAWAGECWAIEAELTPKTVIRTVAIMRDLLSRTADFGGPAAETRRPGWPPRYARAVYVCAPAAVRTVARARAALGRDAARIEIRALPPDGFLPSPAPATRPDAAAGTRSGRRGAS
jgi:hypothetical protein